MTVVEPRSGWHVVDFGEFWRYRELLYFLVWRDIKVRYKQTVLGVAWVVLQPMAMMAVFCVFLGRVGGARSADVPYPLFVFTGLLPWTFFAAAVTAASGSVVGSQQMITKIYFPRLLIPVGAIGAPLFDFAIAFTMLLVLMPVYGSVPGPGLALALFPFLGLVITALGIGTLLAAVRVIYRDVGHVVPFAVQFGMFATPVIYLQDNGVEPRWQALMPLNPAYGLIANFRHAVLGEPWDLYALGVSGGVGLALLIIGCLYFHRLEPSFADLI